MTTRSELYTTTQPNHIMRKFWWSQSISSYTCVSSQSKSTL